LKVVLAHRVLPHWRIPVFQRLADWPDIDFVALHGSDFPGTKTLNAKDLSGFEHRKLFTMRLISKITDEREIAFPLWPSLPWHLWRERPDVVLTEGGSSLPNAFLLLATTWLLRIPVVWWTLGEIPHPQPLSFSQRLFRTLVRFLERRCVAYLGFSSMAREYFERCGYSRESQFVAVNCVDTDAVEGRRTDARAQADALRTRLGLIGKRVLLFVGALAPYKRVEDLILVYARLRKRHPDLRLLIVGGGNHQEVLEAYADEVDAKDVTFTGEVIEGVGPFFEVGDVLVLPGLGGLAISEAMTHGLPIVATLADGCEADLIQEGANGHVLAAGDTEQLESRLEALLADPDRIQRMGERSRAIIEHEHNINTYMENLVAALHYAGELGTQQDREQ